MRQLLTPRVLGGTASSTFDASITLLHTIEFLHRSANAESLPGPVPGPGLCVVENYSSALRPHASRAGRERGFRQTLPTRETRADAKGSAGRKAAGVAPGPPRCCPPIRSPSRPSLRRDMLHMASRRQKREDGEAQCRDGKAVSVASRWYLSGQGGVLAGWLVLCAQYSGEFAMASPECHAQHHL